MGRWRRSGVLVTAAAVAAIVVSAAPLGSSAPEPAARPGAAAGALPSPVMPAFRPGPPRRLGARRHVSVWAPVSQATAVRAGPGASAAAVARLSPRTPEGTRNVVAVLRRRTGSKGAWVRVALAVLPNGSTGWVPRSALGGYGTLRTRLEVDLARMRATLFRDGTAVFRAAVGVGRTATPTPAGSFYVRNRLSRYRSPTYGPVAFGTSARSPRATDWPAGGFIGIHGTDRPDLIPGRISHGCIRMANADILELARRMPVGTPVDIR